MAYRHGQFQGGEPTCEFIFVNKDLLDLVKGIIPLGYQSELTVRTFLNGFLGDIGGNASSFEMVAKAAILFHRSAHVSGQWKPSQPFRILNNL